MGMWVGFFLSFGGWWWWVLLSADLKLGVFTGMNSGGLLGIPTQTELGLSGLWASTRWPVCKELLAISGTVFFHFILHNWK